MPYDPAKHHRRSIRLTRYDYSQMGAYFVTVCAHERTCLFGDVADPDMRLNDAGRLVQAAWDELPGRFPGVELDAFVVMPNHVHGIVVIVRGAVQGAEIPGAASSAPTLPWEPGAATGPGAVGAGLALPAPTPATATLGHVMRAFKSISALYVNRQLKRSGPLWQRNYYERIIRDETELQRIREYIETNPARWADDSENPDGKR
jgi:putative transposase